MSFIMMFRIGRWAPSARLYKRNLKDRTKNPDTKQLNVCIYVHVHVIPYGRTDDNRPPFKFAGPMAQGVLDLGQGPLALLCLLPPYPHSGPLAPKVLTPMRVMASVGRPCKSPNPLRGYSQIELTK